MTAPPRTSTPPRFSLAWRINDGDILPIRNAPTGMTRFEGRDCLYALFHEARAAGYSAAVVDMDGTFVVRKDGDVARVFIQEMTVSAVEWQEQTA